MKAIALILGMTATNAVLLNQHSVESINRDPVGIKVIVNGEVAVDTSKPAPIAEIPKEEISRAVKDEADRAKAEIKEESRKVKA